MLHDMETGSIAYTVSKLKSWTLNLQEGWHILWQHARSIHGNSLQHLADTVMSFKCCLGHLSVCSLEAFLYYVMRPF
jgi:hypothetical protein